MPTRPDDEPARPPLDDLLNDAIKSYLCDSAVSRSGIALLAQPARPLVVDANRLRGEIRTLARNGHDTALVTLARTGFLHLFAARHVFDEVDQYLDRWARETRTPVTAYRAAWTSELRPLISEVSFPRDLLTPDELTRIELLDRPHPLGDPDDVPTAIAAMVLAAPLLSGDQKPLDAVYGPTVDPAKHDAYRDALFGGGRVFVLSQMGLVSLMLVQLLGGIGAAGIRAVGTRTGTLPLALTAAAAGIWASSTERPRAWLARRAHPLRAIGTAVLEIYAFYRRAEADYNQLQAPLVHDLDRLPARVKAARDATRQAALDSAASRLAARTDD